MNEPNRTQWQIRCAFNGFCKRALKNEAMNAHRDTKQRQLREITFSDLSPEEENRLFVCDEYFADDEAEQSFVIGGKEITAKLLAEALHSLPDEKRETVLLYWASCEIRQNGQNYRYQQSKKSEVRNDACGCGSVQRECEIF